MRKVSSNSNVVLLHPDSQAGSYDPIQQRAENAIGRRIAELRHEAGMTLAEFCVLLSRYGIDLTPAAINKWEKGVAAPGAYQLLALCSIFHVDDPLEYFSTTSRESSLNEEGRKLLRDFRKAVITSGLYQAEPETIELPTTSMHVSAGTGILLFDDESQTRTYYRKEIPKGTDFAVVISGDSMEPVFYEGETVLVQRCTALSENEVGIFLYDGEGYIKAYTEQTPSEELADRFCHDGQQHMQPVLHSYNARYKDREINPDLDFRIIGRVLGKCDGPASADRA